LVAILVAFSGPAVIPSANAQSTYLDPQTGRDCIRSVRQYEEPNSYRGGSDFYWVLANDCGRDFSVIADLVVVDPSNTEARQTSGVIRAQGETTLRCANNPYNRRQSCNGFTGDIQVY
jgi:hypothetical protein